MDELLFTAELGMCVEIELSCGEEVERLTVDIVEDDQADYYAGFLGKSTPLAKAILGHHPGETVPYSAGDVECVHILSVSVSTRGPEAAKRNADERQKALKKTHREIDATNAMIFSSTIEGKWGDYDADAVNNWVEQEDHKP